jgi:hypothetical protein
MDDNAVTLIRKNAFQLGVEDGFSIKPGMPEREFKKYYSDLAYSRINGSINPAALDDWKEGFNTGLSKLRQFMDGE